MRGWVVGQVTDTAGLMPCGVGGNFSASVRLPAAPHGASGFRQKTDLDHGRRHWIRHVRVGGGFDSFRESWSVPPSLSLAKEAQTGQVGTTCN